MKLSIIIPARNEAHRLPPVLASYAAYFSEKMGGEAEIILVVNGSTDHTAEAAAPIAEKYSNIQVIQEPRKIGKGGAVILGMKMAVGEYIGFVDADGATMPADFFRLYSKAVQGDGAIASRWIEGADVTVPQKAVRQLISRLFNCLTRILLGLKYRDTQCGAKIFRCEAWRAILPDIGTTRFAFDVDVLFQLKRKGFLIKEEATVWKDVAGSKVRFLSSSFDMFCAIIRIRLLYSPFRFIVRVYERVFAGIVKRLRHDTLFCDAMLLAAVSIAGHICSLACQMVVSRSLTKEDYALLASFLSLFAIISYPLGTLGTAMVHYASLLVSEGRTGTVKRLIRKWGLRMGLPAIAMCMLCIFSADRIAVFFHLERMAPVVIFAIALPALFLTPVFNGALRGLQWFGWLSMASVVNALGKLTLVYAFIRLSYPSCGWVLLGHIGGMYLTVLFCLAVLLIFLVKIPADRQALPSFRAYLVPCFFIQMSLAWLMTGDVIVVKHYLPDKEDFAYAATLGRIVVFFAAAVPAAMFPKVASSGEFTIKHRRIYLRALMYTAGFLSILLIVCALFPRLLWKFLFGISSPNGYLIGVTRWMSVVMTMAAILKVNISFLLAQRCFKAASIVPISALMYILGVHFAHGSELVVVAISGAANLAALVVTTAAILLRKTQNTESN